LTQRQDSKFSLPITSSNEHIAVRPLVDTALIKNKTISLTSTSNGVIVFL